MITKVLHVEHYITQMYDGKSKREGNSLIKSKKGSLKNFITVFQHSPLPSPNTSHINPHAC